MLKDPSDLFERWLALCKKFDIKGRPSHDARLIALAEAHSIEHFLTLDPGHFNRFSQLNIVTP